MFNIQRFRQLAHNAGAEMGRVFAHARGWWFKRGTPANKLLHGAVRRALFRRSHPCVSTLVLGNDQHVLKSIISVNSGIHRGFFPCR